MKNQMIVTVSVPVVIALAIQAYMMVKLTGQMSRISDKIDKPTSQQLGASNFPILTPAQPGCESDVFERRRESL